MQFVTEGVQFIYFFPRGMKKMTKKDTIDYDGMTEP